MPVLSMFYGIVVRMQREEGGRHKVPHIHASYQGEEVVVSLDGDVLEGSIPAKRQRMLLGWIAIHEDDLKADWELLNTDGEYFKIEPLK